MCDKLFALCNVNFTSQYAFINGIQISISDYILQNNNNTIKCCKGHELILANGKIKKPYFRHKNTNDVGGYPCTKWHTEWQGLFPITEYEFPKINENQIKNRRTDAFLKEHNLVIEFQHSNITKPEVNNRKNDYELNNQKIIWIIHGQESIKIRKVENLNRIYLEFIDNDWKYKSFTEHDYIYIDIDDKIFKLYPNDVKNNMIDILQENIYDKEVFIELLKNNDKRLYDIIKPEQCTLYLKQQGAGNGKTYGIIQMLESKEFEHYDCLIVVSKQHSAKYVIYNELNSQIDNLQLKKIKLLDNKELNKKYKIKFNNAKNNKDCHLIIGTIDSLMYTLGNKNTKEYDKFKGLVNSIIDGYVEDENINAISYGSINIRLNKKMCLIIDETQDLNMEYGKAIFELMRSRYIDAYIVGDKLQSLAYDNNAFVYMLNNECSYINKIICEKTNICRRFYHPELVNFVNDIIPFEKYELPKITPYKDAKDYENTIIPIKISNDSSEENKINKIMEYYVSAVNNYNYNPNDFLIITPFTNMNKIACSLEIAINNYWCEKLNTNNFTRHAIFHKSEEGTSINLSESENATRIVSIHTSKGDGRKAVFIIGLNERSLLKFSKETDNLIYNSLIHVVLTRAKERIYIIIENEYDDINKRFTEFCKNNNIIYDSVGINMSKNIKFNNIVDLIKNNLDYNDIYNNIINKTDNIKKLIDDKNDKEIIDLGHHSIRYASMIISLYLNIVVHENNNKTDSVTKRQIYAIFKKVSDMQLHNCDTVKEYINLIDNNTEKYLAIVKIYNKGEDYMKYNKIINDFIISIKLKLKKIINYNKIINLCPYECMILNYMIQITENGLFSSITISDLYNITDIYNKTFNDGLLGHEKCICKDRFKLNEIIEDKYDMINKYLLNHYEQIKNLNKIYEKFLNEHKNTNWLIEHRLNYNGTNDEFYIYKNFTAIGYNDKDIYNIFIKPQVNTLNYNEILLDSIYDTHLINSYYKNEHNNNNDNNINRFSNKPVKTIVFTFDNDSYYKFDWIYNNNLINEYNELIVNKLYQKLEKYYSIDVKYIYIWYKNTKEKYKNESPSLIITKIIEELNNFIDAKKKKNIPHYLIKFFEGIESIINHTKKKERLNELSKYDNNEYFIKELNKVISMSLKIFLDIPIVEDDDDDDERESDE